MNETGIIMTPIGPAGDDLDVVMGANMARPQVDNQSSNKYQKLICSRALFWSIWGFPYFGQFRVPCIVGCFTCDTLQKIKIPNPARNC